MVSGVAGEALQRAGVAFHDLAAVFADVDETVYTDTCCHLNRKGCRMVAEQIATVVRRGL